MSIAWSTIAFLVLLLPGFLFFVGLYFPENFTRETAPKSPLGQLAGTVLVSFFVHGLLYGLSLSVDAALVPQINLDHVLQLLQVEPLNDQEYAEVIRGIEAHRWLIFGYILAAAAFGLWLGYETGCSIVHGPLRRLAEHGWVYDLKIEGGGERAPGLAMKLLSGFRRAREVRATRSGGSLWSHIQEWRGTTGGALKTVTVAYVLTTVSHDQRYLMYRGFLKAFGISKDGKPLYLVLTSAMRSYLLLEEFGSRTGPGKQWHLVGSSSDIPSGLPGPRLSSYLVVSGDRIANVVFDRHGFKRTAEDLGVLEDAYKKSVQSGPKPPRPRVGG